MPLQLSQDQIETFQRDGFLLVDRLLDPALLPDLRARFAALFKGQFETGLQPDEWNWREGRDAPDLTRQICNAWKADSAIRRVVTSAWIGEALSRLMGWPGARLNQDNALWKPPGAKALGFHQDDSYQDWVVPAAMATCWMALDTTSAQGGTIVYARGSHTWPVAPPIAQFHAPGDPIKELKDAAAAQGLEADLVAVEVPAGGGSFHHGRTWHGSFANQGNSERRALVSHCMRADARFHDTKVGSIYGRYKLHGSTVMEESFFPILWTAKGGRSAFLD